MSARPRPCIVRPTRLARSSMQIGLSCPWRSTLASPRILLFLSPRMFFVQRCTSCSGTLLFNVLPISLTLTPVETLPIRHSSHTCPSNFHLHPTIHHGGRPWHPCRP